MIWNYMQPVTIHFGNGRIHELGGEIEKLGGSRGILITSPSFVEFSLKPNFFRELPKYWSPLIISGLFSSGTNEKIKSVPGGFDSADYYKTPKKKK